MKRILITAFSCFLISSISVAQIVQSELKTQARHATINVAEANANNVWNINLQTVIPKPKSNGNIKEIKQLNNQVRIANLTNIQQQKNQKRTRGNAPTIGQSFQGNSVVGFTPSDNSVAISNDGKIVSVTNQNFEVYDTNGTQLLTQAGWNVFLDAGLPDSTFLIRGKFDPRALYDPYHDRFIVCILHEYYDTAQSQVLLAFSKTNDPLGAWNIYNISGNPLLNKGWTDYPSMGINEFELFFNANLFGIASDNYAYKGTYVHQIDLDSAYAGGALQYKTWSGFGLQYGTLNPASNGQMIVTGDRKMNFATQSADTGSIVHLFTISDTMNAPSVAMSHTQYPVPFFSACADGIIKDPNNPIADTIGTGAAWIQNAFLLDNKVHYTFSANVSGDCGINYGRIDLVTQTASYVTYAEPGNMLAYPAIASIGYTANDKNIVMAYLRASANILPEVGVISIDDSMNWSAPQVVKIGDTIVNILPIQYHERWGDYTGIQRKYSSSASPEVWLFGSYSANTPPRKNSWANWIAQIRTNNFPVAVNNISPTAQTINVYPNPARSMYAISFDLEKAGDVSVSIFDLNGRKIKTLFNGKVPASHNELSFDRNALVNGQYFLQVIVDGAVQTKKLIVVE